MSLITQYGKGSRQILPTGLYQSDILRLIAKCKCAGNLRMLYGHINTVVCLFCGLILDYYGERNGQQVLNDRLNRQ